MKFLFGKSSPEVILAPNIEVAKKMFKASVLFPEEFLDHSQLIEDGEWDSTAKHHIGRKPKPKAAIPIFDEEWNKLGSIPISECLDFKYDDLQSTSQHLLTGPGVADPENEENLPVIGKPSLLALSDKASLREKNDLIAAELNKLAVMRENLERSVAALHKELTSKRRVIAMVETFLGIQEEVILLADGTPAPEEEPLHLFQQKLYMDEEIGIWSDGGLDFQDLDQFDEWTTKNINTFLYRPKAVCAFQVRRTSKQYTDNALANAFMNEDNYKTYWLIRNGERIYRIWSDIHIGDKVFPGEQELDKVLSEYSRYGEDHAKNKMERWRDSYVFGMLALQGMIERTDIFGTSLRGVVNFARPHGIPPDRVVMVRDAETKHWIGDGRPSWRDYCKVNREAVKQGTRILIVNVGSSRKDDAWRTEPFRASWPGRSEVYTVEEMAETNTYHGWSFLIRYDSGDDVYRPGAYGEDRYSKRKKRVPFRLYKDEVLNVDDITLEDIDYYMRNRLYRTDYLDIMPALHIARAFKAKEAALEEEFVKLLASKLGWDETQYQAVRDAIKWWKLKNKWKRAVTKDEAKAMRMILGRLKGAA